MSPAERHPAARPHPLDTCLRTERDGAEVYIVPTAGSEPGGWRSVRLEDGAIVQERPCIPGEVAAIASDPNTERVELEATPLWPAAANSGTAAAQ